MRFTSVVAVGAIALAAGTAILFKGPADAAPAIAAVPVEYKAGDVVCEGLLATLPGKWPSARPGILVVHDWMGVSDFTKRKCETLATMGYVAFAADVYGKGVRPKDWGEAGQLAGKYKGDRPLFRARIKAALDTLLKVEGVDPARIVVMGYCFGGTGSIELARSGAPVAGVISFHGGLDSPTPLDGKNIKGKVLALHGADDPYVKAEDLAAFEEEMRSAHVDWQLVKYGNAVHAFTNPAAGTDNAKGAAFNEVADRRSWEAMKAFFAEVFASK